MDAVVKLALGILLLVYPQWLADALGMPPVATTFFPNILGGVLFGIGLALLVAYRGGWAAQVRPYTKPEHL